LDKIKLSKFSNLAQVVSEIKSKHVASLFQLLLSQISPSPPFILPLNPSQQFSGFKPQESMVFSSKQRPMKV